MAVCAFNIEKGVFGFQFRAIMWWNKSLWLLLAAILLVRDAEGFEAEWSALSTHPYDELIAAESVAQPGKATYLLLQPEVEDSVFSEQDLESSEEEDVDLMWESSDQNGFAEVLTDHETEAHGQWFPGRVSQPQLQDSSYIETWKSEPSHSVSFFPRPPSYAPHLNTMQISRPPAFLPQTKLDLLSLASEDSDATPDGWHTASESQLGGSRHPGGVRPSWFEGSWQTSSLQTGLQAPHSQMWGPGVTHSHHQPGKHVHKGPSRPGHLHSQHEHKARPTGHHAPSGQHAHSQMWGPGVTHTHHQPGKHVHKEPSRPGHPHSQHEHKARPTGHHAPSGQHAHSQMWGPGVTHTHHQPGKHVHKEPSRPGHLHSQHEHEAKPTGHHAPSGQHAHSQMWGPGVTHTHHQPGRDDAHQSHSHPVHIPSHEGHKGRLPSHHQPSGQSAHSPTWSSGMTTHTQSGKHVHKGPSPPGHGSQHGQKSRPSSHQHLG